MGSKKIVNIKKDFSPESGNIYQNVTDFVQDTLSQIGITKNIGAVCVLLSEETTVQFLRHAQEGSTLRVHVRRFLGDTNVILTMPGEEFDPYDSGKEDSEDVIRSRLFRAVGEKFKYSNRNHVNRVRLQTGQEEHALIYYTVISMILGVLFGFLARFLFPGTITDGLCTYVLGPVKTIFMNSLKIIIGPIVFLSIVTCFSQFKSIEELGRIGIKVMGMYLLTTIFAIILGIGSFAIFQPGSWGFVLRGELATTAVSLDVSDVDISLLNTIINIVPSNFVQPFVASDTLQLIFLAVICGVSLGKIKDYSEVLQELFEALYSLFMTMTNIFIKVMPLAIFASMAIMIVDIGAQSLIYILQVMGLFILAIVAMLCIYGVLVMLLGKSNPITFFRNVRESMLTSFILSSSSAAMPTTLRTCTDKLGISPKICNFSIPLGATVNMDGNCIFYAIMGLFLARAYGVAVPMSSMFSFSVTIMLLSFATPGVPGAGIIMLATVLKSISVPVEAIGLLMGMFSLMGMIQTMCNTTGDVAISLIVAKTENLLDQDLYNRTT